MDLTRTVWVNWTSDEKIGYEVHQADHVGDTVGDVARTSAFSTGNDSALGYHGRTTGASV
jgi:hypothetical protein